MKLQLNCLPYTLNYKYEAFLIVMRYYSTACIHIKTGINGFLEYGLHTRYAKKTILWVLYYSLHSKFDDCQWVLAIYTTVFPPKA